MRTRQVLAAAIVAASFLLSGCASLTGLFGGVTRDDGGSISEGGDLGTNEMVVGDCFDDFNQGGLTASVDAIPCAEEHVYEVFHDFSLPEGDYPSDSAMEDAVYEECDPAFADFVGVTYDESELEYFYFSPTEEGWTQYDDRLISCIIGTEGVRVTGSVKGSGS
jgi:hypothetical protein